MAATLVALACPVLVADPALAAPAAGFTSGGDPYFPHAGNRGYDVGHYDLTLAYKPRTGRLDGTAVISLRATADLTRFSLDLRRLKATSVKVDGKPASFSQQPPDRSTGLGGELVVRPGTTLRKGTQHTVRVVYGGVPGQPTDIDDALYGWVSFPDGAFVANEPEGASTWFPVNDIPSDKATYDFRITVPEGTTAVANGELVGEEATSNGRHTFVWEETDPMASYLATASIGDYRMTRQTGPGGLPILNFVDEDLSAADRAATRAALKLQPEILDFLDHLFGPYPFTSAGAIVDDDEDAGYALETQTRPLYAGAPDDVTVAHELAHQWVGDSVTPAKWRDIWLNEGFATYAEWLWGQHQGGPTPQERFRDVMSTPASDEFWDIKPADPGAVDLFAAATYDRGAATLQALRKKIGDADFFTLLRRWTTSNRFGTVSTADFTALAERVSGKQLDGFFHEWLYTPEKPTP
ncbi:MAG: M1 family metallopeptidase [Microvirga sp.]